MFQIFIKELRLYGYHGVHEFEKKKGQFFVFNIKIKLDKNRNPYDDRIDNTVNYSKVIKTVKKINSENKFDLLETLVYVCAEELLKSYEQIDEVKISAEKENPPIDEKLKSVGVSCKLKRDDFISKKDKVKTDDEAALRKSREAYLSLGTNIGNRLDNLKKAIMLLLKTGVLEIIKISSIYETEPMYYKQQPKFYNIILSAKLKSDLSPFVLLGYIKDIEYSMGRKYNSLKNSPRIIDIDILDIENEKVESSILTIPHPKMNERNFVLIPLAEVSPEYIIDDYPIKEFIEKSRHTEKVNRIINDILVI